MVCCGAYLRSGVASSRLLDLNHRAQSTLQPTPVCTIKRKRRIPFNDHLSIKSSFAQPYPLHFNRDKPRHTLASGCAVLLSPFLLAFRISGFSSGVFSHLAPMT